MKAVIFDLDGTLLDTLDDLTDATNAALCHFGCPQRTREEVRQFVGNGAERLMRLALPGKADDPAMEEILPYYKTYYAAHSQKKTRPYAGILEALEQVRQEFPVAVVTNKPDHAAKNLCAEFFGDVYALGERSDIPRKPAADMVHRAMAAIGADSCIYVGDSEVDVLTAKNAGVPCLSVLWGFRDREMLLDAGAKYFCDTPAELFEKLKEMI